MASLSIFILIIHIYINVNHALMETGLAIKSILCFIEKLYVLFAEFLSLFFSRYRDVYCEVRHRCGNQPAISPSRRFSREFEDDRSPSEILQYHAAPRELGYMIDDFPIAAPHCSALKGPRGLVTFVEAISWPVKATHVALHYAEVCRCGLEYARRIIAWVVRRKITTIDLQACTRARR